MKIVFETNSDKDIQNAIKKTIDYASKYFDLPKNCEIMLSFLTEEQIKTVNKNSREIDSVTDVLSFPYLENIKNKKINIEDYKTDINPFSKNLMLGEINICEKRAKEQAETFLHSYKRECAYLALHGFLHLLGFDHLNENDKKEMRKAEEEILNSVNIKR